VDRSPDNLRDERDVDELAGLMFGADLSAAEGVVHVTAVWASPSGELVTLGINDETPESRWDGFSLGLARARADVIVTTGQILRDEPELRLAAGSPPGTSEALRAWRLRRRGRSRPPEALVLTSGRELDLDHPLFREPARRTILTGEPRARQLAVEARRRGIGLVGLAAPDPRAALEYLREKRAARTICVEAGPTTSSGLYEPPCAVDELCLSVLHAPAIPAAARGKVFCPGASLESLAGPNSRPFEVREAGARWTFHRCTPS
jgi:riboflavin biosynthesis pyrimidine reductase